MANFCNIVSSQVQEGHKLPQGTATTVMNSVGLIKSRVDVKHEWSAQQRMKEFCYNERAKNHP